MIDLVANLPRFSHRLCSFGSVVYTFAAGFQLLPLVAYFIPPWDTLIAIFQDTVFIRVPQKVELGAYTSSRM